MTPSLNKCPRCGTLRPSGEVAHTCVARSTVPDHEAAKKWAHDVWGTLKDIALHEVLETDAIDHRNTAACYLDAMTQLEAVRTALGGYKDSDLASLAMTLKAQLDKATELLRAALGRSECYDEDHECGETDTTRAIRAFLSERKTNDKQS